MFMFPVHVRIVHIYREQVAQNCHHWLKQEIIHLYQGKSNTSWIDIFIWKYKNEKKHEDSLTDLTAALRPMVIKKNQCCSVKAEKFNLLLVLKKPKSKKKNA